MKATSLNAIFKAITLWCIINGQALAERPSIEHVRPDTDSRWKDFSSELGREVRRLPELRQATGLKADIDRVEPLLVAVVLNPGSPISKFGASVVEHAFVKITGKGAFGQPETFVLMVSRFPYSASRQWEFLELISEVHLEPPLKSFLPITNPGDASKNFLSFVKKVFEPGVCMSASNLVIDVIAYDANISAFVGHLPADDDIRKLFPTGD